MSGLRSASLENNGYNNLVLTRKLHSKQFDIVNETTTKLLYKHCDLKYIRRSMRHTIYTFALFVLLEASCSHRESQCTRVQFEGSRHESLRFPDDANQLLAEAVVEYYCERLERFLELSNKLLVRIKAWRPRFLGLRSLCRCLQVAVLLTTIIPLAPLIRGGAVLAKQQLACTAYRLQVDEQVEVHCVWGKDAPPLQLIGLVT